MEQAVLAAVDSECNRRRLVHAYMDVFASKTPEKLGRFRSLHKHIVQEQLPKRLAEYQQSVLECVSKLLHNAVQSLHSNPSPTPQAAALQRLATGVQGCVICLMVQIVKNRRYDMSGFTLEEDEPFKTRRAEANAQLAKIHVAQDILANISSKPGLILANTFHLDTQQASGSTDDVMIALRKVFIQQLRNQILK